MTKIETGTEQRVGRNTVFVVRNLALGGIPRVVIELSAAWSRLVPEDKVHLVLLDDSKRHYDAPENVQEHDMTHLLNDLLGKLVRAGNRFVPNLFSKLTMGRNSRALTAWAKNLEQQNGLPVDLVICGYGAISALEPCKLPNAICIAHNLYAAMLQERTGKLAALNAKILQRSLQGVKTFGISNPIRDSLRKDVSITMQEDVLFNPIDTDRIRTLAEQGNALPDAAIEAPYFMYLGRLSPEKNVDAIISAFAALPKEGSERLLIAGAGEERDNLEKLAAQTGRDVVFLGAVSNPYPLIKEAKALVLASDFEGMPTVLLEARALGTPIVTSSAQGTSLQAVEGYDPVIVIDSIAPQPFSEALQAIKEQAHTKKPDPLDLFSIENCVQRYRKGILENAG